MKKIVVMLYLFSCIQFLHAQVNSIDLNFDSKKYELQTLSSEGKTFQVRAYENIVYASKLCLLQC